MSDTYIGWDGKSYPWPPPDGWYHASDGRWWAPNTGPNPPPTAAPSRFERTAPLENTSRLDNTSQYPEHDHPDRGHPGREPYPAHDTELLAPATAGVASGVATPSYFDDPGPLPPPGPSSQLPPPGPSGPPGPDLGPDEDPYGYGVPAAAAGPVAEGGLGPKKLVIGVAAVLAVVAIGVSAFLLQNDDNTATDAGANSTTLPGATTVATPATLPPASAPASVVDPAATTVAPADPAASSTLAADDAALVGTFRDLLVQQGLTSDKLSDTEIQSFAASFCVFAKSSDNGDEFNVFREQAISETQSALDPASLNKVIDAAVITFCPDEATRLGITVG